MKYLYMIVLGLLILNGIGNTQQINLGNEFPSIREINRNTKLKHDKINFSSDHSLTQNELFLPKVPINGVSYKEIKKNKGQSNYRPLSAMGDSVRRTLFSYDNKGDLLVLLYQEQSNGEWVNVYRYTLTYDTKNNLITKLDEVYVNGEWKGSWRYSYKYDSNNNQLTELIETLSHGAWVYAAKDTYTYDSNSNMLTHLNENWRYQKWENYSRDTYTYDSNNNLLTAINEEWVNNNWLNYYMDTYTYDSKNTLLIRIRYKGYAGNWVNNSKFTYTYDSYNNIMRELIESWSNGAWTNYHRNSYSYDANGDVITQFEESCSNNIWKSEARYSNSYDVNGNKLTALTEGFDNEGWSYNNKITLYCYDVNNNMVRGENFIWANNHWVPNPSGYISIYINNKDGYVSCHGAVVEINYTNITKVEKNLNSQKDFNLFQNFPNPFNPSTQIKYSTPVPGIVSITVYDILGREVKTLVNEYQDSGLHSIMFDAQYLPSGIYFYKIISGKYSSTKKLVLMK